MKEDEEVPFINGESTDQDVEHQTITQAKRNPWKLNKTALSLSIFGCMLLLAVVIVAVLFTSLGRSPASRSQTLTYEPIKKRYYMLLERGWTFRRADVIGAEKEDFEEGGDWVGVELPHTWNNYDGQDGGSPEQGGDYYRGTAWYRRQLVLPNNLNTMNDLAHYIQFNGSNRITDVFINGHHLGQHRGGFAAFRFDLTPYLRPNGINILAVRVNNTGDVDIPPLTGDFTFFGGLYRGVELVSVKKDAHFAMRDHGGPGVYFTPKNVTERKAEFEALARLENDGERTVQVSVRFVVVDTNNQIVLNFTTLSANIAAKDSIELTAAAQLSNPHLWNGINDPYLYTAHAELLYEGETVDFVSQPLGFRSFFIDAKQGFFLNGHYLDLHGVSFHQDRIDKGWAISKDNREEDMSIVLEMGATAIRLAHYQHDQYVYDMADRNGLCIWAEVPVIDYVTENSTAFAENASEQLRELIRQNYNHPSIFFWSLTNEPRKTTNTDPVIALLNEVAHREDPSRLTTMAHCCRADDDSVVNHTDVHAYNKYYGWYKPLVEQVDTWATSLHESHPEYRFAVSEYGAGASIHHHGYDGNHHPDTQGNYHPEEWQAMVHEHNWAAFKIRPYIWGKFIWNAFDFASDTRHEGEADGINDKGLVTYDRQIRKDAYYFYKSQWTTSPFVHIVNRRFVHRQLQLNDVKLYTTMDHVTLLLNNEVIGESDVPENRTVLFRDVKLKEGENIIVATAKKSNGVQVADEVRWVYRPVVRINSGARSTNSSTDGTFWDTDHYVTGGTWNATDPMRAAELTLIDPNASQRGIIYGTFRAGELMEYTIPIANGSYTVRIHLIEPALGDVEPHSRVVNVFLQDRAAFMDVDISAQSNKGLMLETGIDVLGGLVHVKLEKVIGMVALAGIEIIPGQ
ncbi:uncharacterized protein VTP21DRAFT_1265 [Calcarisporiella thermophila]|uniref:uncharacterized protein n=1 Tax=Calcarisporiella thermophila TaxID=911321 RepID=UPI0037443276